MFSIMKSYKEYANEMKGEERVCAKKPRMEEFVYGHREDLMLKGQNQRGFYSSERVCLANDRKR